MNAELAESGALELAIGRMVFDGLNVAAEPVARMQDRGMPVGEPRAFVERAASERAQPVQIRLDVAEQRIWQMNAQQVRQGWIGAVEIHAGGVRCKQSRPVRITCGVTSDGLQHISVALVRSALSCRL